MKHFAEKSEEDLILASQKIEAGVVKYPIIIPVIVVHTVLPDIAIGARKAVIARRHPLQIEDSA